MTDPRPITKFTLTDDHDNMVNGETSNSNWLLAAKTACWSYITHHPCTTVTARLLSDDEDFNGEVICTMTLTTGENLPG